MGFPEFVFGRADAVAGEVSLMDSGEGFPGCGDETLAVTFDHRFLGPSAQAGNSPISSLRRNGSSHFFGIGRFMARNYQNGEK